MQAMVLTEFGQADRDPLSAQDVAVPEPGLGEVLIKVDACGVCRTDLHVVEGELSEVELPVIPGHQVIGTVAGADDMVDEVDLGDRVGVAWVNRTCGLCEFCCSDRENLCRNPTFTGCHVNGGYAEYVVASAPFVYPIDSDMPAEQAAPLLCAGIIGYRALAAARGAGCTDLGLVGFGSSAHVCIQIARHWGMDVFVFSRTESHRAHARELGAMWAGELGDDIGVKLDAAINFTPAGWTVPAIMEYLDHGGRQIIAGIEMSEIPAMDYRKHVYYERGIESITSARREDGAALLNVANEIGIRVDTTAFELARANEALSALKAGELNGSAVLTVGG